MRNGIPVTTVAQTLIDLASMLPDEELDEAVDAAIQLSLYDQRAIDAVCGRGRAGTGKLRDAVARRHPDAHDSKSRWERRMLKLLDAQGIPRPRVNQPIVLLGLEPDLLWPIERVVVEWDSWAHHRRREQFESDREKTLTLQRSGYTVLRFTWRMTNDHPERVAADIRAALARTGSPRSR